MLKTLQVNHFKSIESAEIDFERITVFVGNNGSGKTNIVDAIRFLRDATQNGLDRAFSDRHGVESVRQWSPTRPFRISIATTMEGNRFWGKYSVSIDSARGQFHVFREEVDAREHEHVEYVDEEDGEPITIINNRRAVLFRDKDGSIIRRVWQTHSSDPAEPEPDLKDSLIWDNSGLEQSSDKIDQTDELSLNVRRWEYSALRTNLTNFQAYSIYPNTLRLPQEPSNETFLAPEGRNLASVFKRMRRTRRGLDAINQIVDAMKAILPNLDRISILSVGGYLVPQFHVIEPTGKNHTFNVSQMSDGTLRVLGLLTALYQEPRPGIIALEEPEQTVNPGILAVLADAIKEVGRRTQVIVTTHSPHLLDQFHPEQIRTVELRGGLSQIGPIAPTQMNVVRDRLFTLGELLVAEGLHA